MPVFALLVISKAGSLLYHRTFPSIFNNAGGSGGAGGTGTAAVATGAGTLGLPGTSALTTNDYLVLAGTFHGVHAITKSLTPRLPTHTPAVTPITSPTPVSASTSNTPQQRQAKDGRPTSSSREGAGGGGGGGKSASGWTYPNPQIPASGIECLESSFFRLTVHQTATGTKFLLFTDPSMSPATTDVIMRGIYDRYADHVCKNPFWQMEMPIRLEGWDREIGKWLAVRR